MLGLAAFLAICLAIGITIDSLLSYPYNRSVVLVIVPATAIMVPIARWMWRRPIAQVMTYAALLSAFACLWTAAGERVDPFTNEQWGLLGVTFIAIAGAAAWRQRQSK